MKTTYEKIDKIVTDLLNKAIRKDIAVKKLYNLIETEGYIKFAAKTDLVNKILTKLENGYIQNSKSVSLD
jgi:hypothetical protein